MSKIKTTGELREFLADALLRIESGELDGDKATKITKMAAQINESFYAEIKIAKIQMEAGQVASTLGGLSINGQ